jgi:hypothetical protein
MNSLPPSHSSPEWRQKQRDRLAEVYVRISQLDSEFQADIPESIDKERLELKDIVFSFSYDVSTVPIEIVSHIFTLCLPADGRVQPSPHAAPLLLTQITSQWREIALNTVKLWSSFDFTFHPRKTPYDGTYALLETWIKRTHSSPQSITLRCSADRRQIPSVFLRTISQYAPQWERIEITFPRSDLHRTLSKFDATVGGPFPKLSALALSIADMPLRIQPALKAFQHAPRLRQLRLFSPLRLSNIFIPAASITTLEIETRFPIEECATMFQQFPTLFSLKLQFIDIDPEEETPAISHAPPLQSLDLAEWGFALLSLVTLPHLRHLYFTMEDGEIGTLLAFLSRSRCTLTQLTLRIPFRIEDFSLLAVFEVVPLLEHLHIEYWEGGPRTLYNHL